MTEKKNTPEVKAPSLSKKREATFDLAADLLKEMPGQLDKAHKALREKVDKDSNYLPVSIQELRTWYENGIQVFRKSGGVAESHQVRPPIRDIVAEATARSERAIDESARAMLLKVRKGAAENGVAGAHIAIVQQAYLSQLTRAIVAPGKSADGKAKPGLHQVAIALCEDLAASLSAKRGSLSDDERYSWMMKITRFNEVILRMQAEVVDVETKLAGVSRQELLSVRAGGAEPTKPDDPFTGSSNDVLLQQVEGLRKQAEDIRQALTPLADLEAGILPQVIAATG